MNYLETFTYFKIDVNKFFSESAIQIKVSDNGFNLAFSWNPWQDMISSFNQDWRLKRIICPLSPVQKSIGFLYRIFFIKFENETCPLLKWINKCNISPKTSGPRPYLHSLINNSHKVWQRRFSEFFWQPLVVCKQGFSSNLIIWIWSKRKQTTTQK